MLWLSNKRIITDDQGSNLEVKSSFLNFITCFDEGENIAVLLVLYEFGRLLACREIKVESTIVQTLGYEVTNAK